MRRRSVLAALGAAAASALAGCDAADRGPAADAAETVTAAPVPTDPPTPREAPPPDLSALGVDDAAALGDRHWQTLKAGPHGFDREAVVCDDDEVIRRLLVTVRARAGASAYHFTFDVRDTDRYPSSPVEPYVELWDDGTTYRRDGRRDPEYTVSPGRAFDAPTVGTTERFRVRRVFDAFADATVEALPSGHSVVGEGLRVGYDVTPRRLRLLERPRDARLTATVSDDPLFVDEYELAMRADLPDRAVAVEERVDHRRLAASPSPPAWVADARDGENGS